MQVVLGDDSRMEGGYRFVEPVVDSGIVEDALGVDFYARPTLEVARDLLGCRLYRGEVVMEIVETEAYLPGDSANHGYRGRTARNAPMWGPPGRAYVYLCYGIHHLLNLVTEAEGQPAAVLIRGARVLRAEELVRQRRGGRLDCIGPGKVSQALAVDRSLSGAALDGDLWVGPGSRPARVITGPRVGIDYALAEHRDAPWRFRVGVAE
jgi:DNA-3-methyladenine glycosylase